MKNPKISIITPSFNQGPFIEETICSVLDQAYPNLEYIIIDGGSTDETVDIIRKYDKHLTHWVSEPDQGQSHAINKGLKHCTGEVFNWLNSDDVLLPDCFRKVVSEFALEKSANVISGTEIHFDEYSEQHKPGTRLYDGLEHNILSSVFYQPSTFWKSEIVKDLGINQDFRYLMDTHLWISYLLKYGSDGFRKIDAPLAKFRLHSDSKSVSLKDGFFSERWLLRKKLADQICHNSTDAFLFEKFIDSHFEIPDFDLTTDLDTKNFKEILHTQILRDAYWNRHYKIAKAVILRNTKLFISSWNSFAMALKVFLIPSFILNRLRSEN